MSFILFNLVKIAKVEQFDQRVKDGFWLQKGDYTIAWHTQDIQQKDDASLGL